MSHGFAPDVERSRRVFGRIFERHSWGGRESRSGPGSSLRRTAAVRAALPGLMAELGVRTLVDAPCGDFHWLATVPLPVERYVGLDVVPELIAANRARHGRRGVEFEVADVTRDAPPRADLVLCRDLLGHLSFADIGAVLAAFARSGSTWLLVTTFVGRGRNVDIETGRWRRIFLDRPPFGFPPPERLIDEHSTELGTLLARKCLGLWHLSRLPLPATSASAVGAVPDGPRRPSTPGTRRGRGE